MNSVKNLQDNGKLYKEVPFNKQNNIKIIRPIKL